MNVELTQIYHAKQHGHSYRLFNCGMQLNAFRFKKSVLWPYKIEVIVLEFLAPGSVKEIISIQNLDTLGGYCS
jgi:hypothetical protein